MKIRISEKLFRLLLSKARGSLVNKSNIINKYFRVRGVKYAIEVAQGKNQTFSVKDHVYDPGHIDKSNSIRGDKIALLLHQADLDHLINQLYQEIDEETPVEHEIQAPNTVIDKDHTTERNNWKELFKAWRLITRVLSTPGVLAETTIEEAIQAISSFKAYLNLLFSNEKTNRLADGIVTPYIHQLICHTPQLLRHHKSLALFQNQVRLLESWKTSTLIFVSLINSCFRDWKPVTPLPRSETRRQ